VNHDQFAAVPEGSTEHLSFKLEAVKIGDEQVLALKPIPQDATATNNVSIRLHNLGPAEAFFVAFHVAMYGAVIFSSPFWLFFIGQFMLPALHLRERKIMFTWLGWATALFAAGVSLTYFVLLPVSLRASVQYSDLMGFSASDWRADEYINFVTKFLLGMGIGFQFPVIILVLVKMGLITHTTLAKYRRHVCVLSFILGAILTTPEVITQVAMAVPLYLLYEISIWIAWYWDWKKKKAEKAKA
jgi:sec-independent protein translocase protein TatC